MNFASDNCSGASPEMIEAIIKAAQGTEKAYGADQYSLRLDQTFSELFDHDVSVFPVITGSAANCLALSTLCNPYSAIICHDEGHIINDESSAPSFFTHGGTLVPLKGENAKLTPQAIQEKLNQGWKGVVHRIQPELISITQATECGTIYTPSEVRAISELAQKNNLYLHMDGARFANAVASLNCHPAEVTWKAGVDVLSFGATKNGALAAEAVIFFNKDKSHTMPFRRKMAGHLISKMRFISAQLETMVKDGLWLKNASNANKMAQRLVNGLKSVPNAKLQYPVEANELFIELSESQIQKLESNEVLFYRWPPWEKRNVIRLVCSFNTTENEVDSLINIIK